MIGRFLVVVLLVYTGPFARAETAATFQPPLPTDDKQVAEQLKTFDPAAVEAAKHYYQSPNVKHDLFAMVESVTPAIIASLEKEQGKTFDPAERDKTTSAISKAATANFDLLIGLNMVAALETLSKEQLLALDQFYSSPIGQSILAKTGDLNKRLPGILQVFMPKFTESVRAEIKAAGLGAN